jgi:hypothetical protein
LQEQKFITHRYNISQEVYVLIREAKVTLLELLSEFIPLLLHYGQQKQYLLLFLCLLHCLQKESIPSIKLPTYTESFNNFFICLVNKTFVEYESLQLTIPEDRLFRQMNVLKELIVQEVEADSVDQAG